jgi:DNA polymerase-3 subunit epsilon
MTLNLRKPIIFFDLETTGLEISTARIIEMSFIKILVDGSQETYTKVVNPEVPIPAETTFFHGFTDNDVKDKPVFKEVVQELMQFIGSADLAGYNVLRFDLPLLAEELLRCDIVFDISNRDIIDVQNIFHKMESRTLSAAYQFYCHKELTEAHSALYDAKATYEVLLAQIEKYKEKILNDTITESEQNDVKVLSRFSIQKKFVDLAGHIVMNENDIPVFNFGKKKGMGVVEVFEKEPQYYDWIMKSQFPEYTKRVFQKMYFSKFGNSNFRIT